MYEKQSHRLEKAYKRTLLRVPDHAHHLDPEKIFYDPERKWLGVEWPENGQLTVHLLTDEESDRWLRGEEITKDA